MASRRVENPIDEYQRRAEDRENTRHGREDQLDAALADAAAQFLTPEDRERLNTMTPRDLLELCTRLAARAGRWVLVQKWAADLAPYVHPRLASVTQQEGNPDAGRSVESLEEELRELEERERALEASFTRGATGATAAGAADAAAEADMGGSLPAEPGGLGGSGKGAARRAPGSAPRNDLH